MPKTFVIIDGSSLVHRAFYALPLLATASGQYTNAVYGFTTMLMRLLDDIKPDAVAVAFDKGKLTFRNEAYSQYKAQRKATPKELSEQFSLAREVLAAFGIATLEQAGYEADDIIGTLAAQASKEGNNVVIVTGDRDALQLIDDRIKVMLTKKGISDMEIMDGRAVQAKYGVTPSQIVDLKGLMGDTSDNIPGVPGVGEKTAVKLISEFGTVENVLINIDKVSGKKLQENLRVNAELAEISKKLATIVRDMPLENLPDDWGIHPQINKLRELFIKLEFKSLLNRLPSLAAQTGMDQTEGNLSQQLPQARVIATGDELGQLFEANQDTLAFYPLVTGHGVHLNLQGMAIAARDFAVYVAAESDAWPIVWNLLQDKGIKKIGHDVKIMKRACHKQGLDETPFVFDTLLAAYLLEPTETEYPLTALSAQYLGQPVGWQEKEVRSTVDYAAWAAGIIVSLYGVMEKQLQESDLDKLYYEIELPLVDVLAAMEWTGIKVAKASLLEMAKEIASKLDELLRSIYSLAGEEFNVNSTKQLGVILFEKLKLPVFKKTKTGYSTDAEVLEKLAGEHEIIDKLLEYRQLVKLKSTYLDGLEGLIHPETGRIHTTFNQTVTVTGRLSSSDPNLQNIPIRSEAGKKIRELFVPGEGFNYIMAADYSQIELRVLAHISHDPGLQDAFVHNYDVHTRTAAEVFGVPVEEVTAEMRSRAKAVNFGIVYGISDYGLSRDIGVSRKEAGLYIENYFAKYHGVKEYIDQIVGEARQSGYVTTLFGRRRFLPDINSSNFNQRSFAERTAMNTPIQGTAADVIKKAMIDVYWALQKSGMKSRLLLQVHDELVLEVIEGEVEAVSNLVKKAMEEAVQLDVPLIADVKIGENWAKAK